MSLSCLMVIANQLDRKLNKMPLKAYVDGDRVIAPLLSEDDFLILKDDLSRNRKTAILPCCGATASLRRRSPHYTQHFFHRPNSGDKDCPARSESFTHRYAKEIILQAAESLNLPADTEVNGKDWRADNEYLGDWRADVLVETDPPIAFEVQLTKQSDDETIIRQKKFLRDGITAVWLFKNPTERVLHSQQPSLPAFEIFYRRWDKSFRIKIDNRRYYHEDLSDFTKYFLTGRLSFSDVLHMSIELTTMFRYVKCANCKTPSHIISARARTTSACGYRKYYLYSEFDINRYYTRTEYQYLSNTEDEIVFDSIMEVLQTLIEDREVKKIRPNFSICPNCQNLLNIWSDFYDGDMSVFIADQYTINHSFLINFDKKHWCYPLDDHLSCSEYYALGNGKNIINK